MSQLKPIGSRHVYTPDESILSIYYFLIQDFYNGLPIYGIQILSCRDNSADQLHLETIPYLSYSKKYVQKILCLCMEYCVTPTDLFTSVDTLMDMIGQ